MNVRRPPQHPVVRAQKAVRESNRHLRVADAITRFAGSMPFVYLHTIFFSAWMLLVERDPWPKLTFRVWTSGVRWAGQGCGG